MLFPSCCLPATPHGPLFGHCSTITFKAVAADGTAVKQLCTGEEYTIQVGAPSAPVLPALSSTLAPLPATLLAGLPLPLPRPNSALPLPPRPAHPLPVLAFRPLGAQIAAARANAQQLCHPWPLAMSTASSPATSCSSSAEHCLSHPRMHVLHAGLVS